MDAGEAVLYNSGFVPHDGLAPQPGDRGGRLVAMVGIVTPREAGNHLRVDDRTKMQELLGKALLQQQRGHLRAAGKVYRELLAAQERVLGADDPETLRTKRELADSLELRGHLQAAEELYRDPRTFAARCTPVF